MTVFSLEMFKDTSVEVERHMAVSGLHVNEDRGRDEWQWKESC